MPFGTSYIFTYISYFVQAAICTKRCLSLVFLLLLRSFLQVQTVNPLKKLDLMVSLPPPHCRVHWS